MNNTYNPVTLTLRNGPTNEVESFRRNVTPNLQASWRRSIRDVGGYWIGTAQWEGSSAEMLDLFQTGMLLEILETTGGMITWQGFLSEMALTYKGQRYTRSWADIANRVKVVYSLMGTNQITNNSCETTVWDAYGTPTTRAISTTWATKGDYSAHVVTDAANEGVIIQASISVTSGKAYQAHVTANIISGTWRLEIYNASGVIDYSDQDTAGQAVITASIGDDNLVSGTVGLRLYCTSATGETYADAAVFQQIATRAETSWYNNTTSQAEYGTIEYIENQIGMSTAAANALAAKLLADRAWAKIKPPTQVATFDRDTSDRLDLTFLGYSATLRNFYTDYGGTEDAASDLITGIIAEAEFVSAASVKSNTLSYYVDDMGDWRGWDLIREITQAGDASGNRWTCGVYAGRKFYYEQASTNSVARIRNGKIVSNGGGPLEGWLAEPGLVAIDDMPTAYDIGARAEDRLNMAWMNEVEWNLGAYLDGETGITYRQAVI
jgi:hypothetical protein